MIFGFVFVRSILNLMVAITSIFLFLQMQQNLLELRNRVFVVVLVVNVTFVTIIYALTEVNDGSSQSLSIPLLCIVESGRIGQSQGYIKPIPFAFIAIFGIIVYLQFICMLFHRFSTFLHVAASTKKNCNQQHQKYKSDKDEEDESMA